MSINETRVEELGHELENLDCQELRNFEKMVLKMLKKQRHDKVQSFKKGQKVVFKGPKGQDVHGRIKKLNKYTLLIDKGFGRRERKYPDELIA